MKPFQTDKKITNNNLLKSNRSLLTQFQMERCQKEVSHKNKI